VAMWNRIVRDQGATMKQPLDENYSSPFDRPV